MDNPIQTFEPNELGRDFVIGDLHGSISCFRTLLAGIKFDPEKDRMFSVGDLVDRGEDSMECLRLLWQPWFHTVLSNHEQMMYEAFNGGYIGNFWVQNGGAWGLEAMNVAESITLKAEGKQSESLIPTDENVEFFELLEKVGKLPYLITINHKSGKKFHIIHAELPPGHEVTDNILSSPGKVLSLATNLTRDGETFLWGRYRYMAFYGSDISNRAKVIRYIKNAGLGEQYNENLGHIISGHTIMQRPLTIVGQTNIDTGAYKTGVDRYHEKVPKWAGLTCVNLDTWEFFRATPTEFKTSEPVVINKSDLV